MTEEELNIFYDKCIEHLKKSAERKKNVEANYETEDDED